MGSINKQPLIKLPQCLAKIAPKLSPETDYSTNSNYKDFEVLETGLDFEIKFDEKILDGFVNYKLIPKSEEVEKIILDITTVEVSKVFINNKETEFTIKNDGLLNNLGKGLIIPIEPTTDLIQLKIRFISTKDSTALQFLNKDQTDGKKHPYLFSQSEPIHARAIYPCFDTPSIKTPFKVKVKSPFPTLVSCLFDKNEDDVYFFTQPIPMPAYLFAIVSGDITSAKIGPRSLIYTEPIGIERCAKEFENEVVEKFLNVLEKLIYKYEWTNYDFLIAPMAFPYGGMENPQLTLANSTIVSGDKENIDVIAHELAHSYSGNLITNASWEHFWLNEGWTVYLERRILASLHGESYRHFSAIIGWQDLEESISGMDVKYTKLIQNLKDGSDPDDAFSTVPYEKGFNFLFHLENTVGGIKKFDPFIKLYFTKFNKKSLDTFQFIETLLSYYYENDYENYLKLLNVDYETWLLKTGLPPKPKFDTSLVDQCIALTNKWHSTITKANENNEVLTSEKLLKIFKINEIDSYSSNQLVVFLDQFLSLENQSSFLSTKNGQIVLEFIRFKYSRIADNNNAEVKFRLFRLLLKGKVQDAYKPLADWLGTVGRMKFVRPGYILLNDVDRSLAVETFKKNEMSYHPICSAMVKKDIHLE